MTERANGARGFRLCLMIGRVAVARGTRGRNIGIKEDARTR